MNGWRVTSRQPCFVYQFMNVPVEEMPRIYLARPSEVLEQLKRSNGGSGYSSLRENHEWGPRARAAGTTDRIPDEWRLTADRVSAMFEMN